MLSPITSLFGIDPGPLLCRDGNGTTGGSSLWDHFTDPKPKSDVVYLG